MIKEIIAVHQDCVLCGEKGRKKVTECAKKGFIIRKVGFTTEEGKDLIHRAVIDHKIVSMPFFTDGEKFSLSLEDFIEKPEKKVKKPKKVAKESKDVAV